MLHLLQGPCPLPDYAACSVGSGTMSISKLPVVVSGDGALGAAITLKQPCAMTQVDWNRANIENLLKQLKMLADPMLWPPPMTNFYAPCVTWLPKERICRTMLRCLF